MIVDVAVEALPVAVIVNTVVAKVVVGVPEITPFAVLNNKPLGKAVALAPIIE